MQLPDAVFGGWLELWNAGQSATVGMVSGVEGEGDGEEEEEGMCLRGVTPDRRLKGWFGSVSGLPLALSKVANPKDAP